MATLTIKSIPPALYESLKLRAKSNRRSINKEVIFIIEKALSIPPIDVEAALERARRIREATANYVVTADEIEEMINEGRE